MKLELNCLYWVSYFDGEELKSFTGILIEQSKNYIVLSKDIDIEIPIENIDRIWKVG